MTRKAVLEVQKNLQTIGWPIKVDGEYGAKTRQAVRAFQGGLASYRTGGRWIRSFLRATGRAGPLTRACLRASVKSGGKCSKNFAFDEWKSKGNGWILVKRRHVRALERYRKELGKPIAIVSGYRDPAHNQAVGGASQSRHMEGDASDLQPQLTLRSVRELKVFTGIGVQKASGLVRHVDNRPGKVSNPTVWFYP